MNFLQFSIKNLFFLFFITLIHPYNFCEAMNGSSSSSAEEGPNSKTPLLFDRGNVLTLPLPSVTKRSSKASVPKGKNLQSHLLSSPPQDNSHYVVIGAAGSSSDEDEFPAAPASSLVRRGPLSHQQDQNFSSDIPILNINPNKAQRRGITRLLENLLADPRNAHLLREDISFETGLVIYDLSKIRRPVPLDDEEEDAPLGSPAAWTDAAYFLEQLDKQFFNHLMSKKRMVLIALGAIEGGLAPWGISPLVMYLGENILSFIPVGGLASDLLVYTVIGSSTLPCMQQIGEFMSDLGKVIFDEKGFTASKEDKGPHIQKTDFEIETGNQRCCNYINIPTNTLSRLFSCTGALFRTLPMALLWWQAETPFPEYRNAFLGPLMFFYFVKTYTENMEFCTAFAHQRATEPLPMLKEKKQILRERIKTLERCVNAEASDDLVEKLYTLIQEELKKKNLSVDGDFEEHISAFSALLIKLTQASAFQNIQEELAVHVHSHESLRPIAEQIGSLQVPGMAKLITDIDKKRGKTGARTLLENLSIFDHGAATIGRFFITSWAVTTVLMYMGVDPVLALYLSFGAAVIDVASRAVGEWYVQKDTFLSLRDVGSRKMAFWPAWWVTNTLSFVNSTFFSIPCAAILLNVMSDCPVYVRAVVALATLPSELTSFYTFFHDRYARLIENVTTLRVRTTSQKRAWLNVHFEKAKKFIHEADQSTIEQIYNLTQGGL